MVALRAHAPARWRSFRLGDRRMLAAAGALFLLGTAVYLPSLANGFAYDDVAIIARDVRVTDGRLGEILRGGYWHDTGTATYRPLVTLSYALDWRVSSGSPAWFHLVNAVWHGAVSALLLLLLGRIGASVAIAALGAALFAVHPVHVEAVANTVGRAELMAAVFMLAAAVLWTRAPRQARRPGGLLVLLALFMFALLSKESAVVLPGLLVLIDVARRRVRPGRVGAWLRSRARPLASLTAALLLYFAARALILGTLTPENLDPTLEVLSSPLHRFYTALQAWPQYARLLFYPRTLLADYGPRIMMPATTPAFLVTAGFALLSFCVLGGLLAWERGRPHAAAALLWFPIAIMPVSNLIAPIGVLVAERTLYVPSVALSLSVVAVASRITFHQQRRATLLAAAIAVLLLAALAARSVVRIADWKSTESIFAALLRDRPDAFRGVWHIARVAVSRGDIPTALRHYSDAVALWPYRQRLIMEAAYNANVGGNSAWSHRLSDHALERWPDDLSMRRLKAALLLDQQDTAAAMQHIAAGLRAHPQDSLLLRMRAAVQRGPVPDGSGLRLHSQDSLLLRGRATPTPTRGVPEL
jgi:protein O-mannosyl-transferase